MTASPCVASILRDAASRLLRMRAEKVTSPIPSIARGNSAEPDANLRILAPDDGARSRGRFHFQDQSEGVWSSDQVCSFDRSAGRRYIPDGASHAFLGKADPSGP